MSVVSPPSTNTNVGNAGAGGSVTQLSAIAWTTSNISINTIQSSRLVPTITSGTQRPFSWFHSKKFRVMHVRGVSGGGGGSTAGVTFPNTSSGQNYSYRYDTYSTVQLTCNPAYGYSFSYWAYGNASAPTSGSISGSNPVSIASTDWTTTDYFNIWCVCTTAGQAVSIASNNDPIGSGNNNTAINAGTTITFAPGETKIFCNSYGWSSVSLTSFGSFAQIYKQLVPSCSSPTTLSFTGVLTNPDGRQSTTWEYYDSSNTRQVVTVTSTNVTVTNTRSVPGVRDYVPSGGGTSYPSNTFWLALNESLPNALWFNFTAFSIS